MKRNAIAAAGLVVALGLLLSAPTVQAEDAPTATPAPGAAPIYDPLEPMNRRLFWFGEALDRAVIRPVALGYKHGVPGPVRKGIGNVFDNLGEPVTFINDVLQLRPKRADDAAARFILNSTLGVLGIFDFAGAQGVPIHYSDFGQTLGRYGVRPGPYLYLPVLGPSDFRDGFGRIVGAYASPLNLHDLHVSVGERVGLAVLDGIDTRANLDDALQALKRSSTDQYAALRSVYLQSRQAKITDPAAAIQQLPDFDASPSSPPPQKH